jgi:hypothetical protein
MSQSSPMELVDRYLQAVRFWMPKSKRQDDLLAELGEDLRSQIEERESELGRPLDRGEIGEVLKRCGAPAVVAARLGPQRSLIGPALYPTYRFVLKMVLLWIMVPVFLFIVGPVNVAYSGGDVGAGIVTTLAHLWTGLFIAAGVITLVFAVLERTHAIAGVTCKWDPGTLPPLQSPERKTSLLHTACELAFGSLGLMWLLLLPHNPFLILGPAAAFLKAAPALHMFYWPIVWFAVLTMVRPAVTLLRPQWGWFPAAAHLTLAGLGLLLVNFVLTSSAHAGFQYVVASDGIANSAQIGRVTAVVNTAILVSLIAAGVAYGITAIVYLWQLVRYLRKRTSGSSQPATLHM